MLASQVGSNVQVQRNDTLEESFTTLTSCHNATVFWLFNEAFGKGPSRDDWLAIGGHINTTGIVKKMMSNGKTVATPKNGASPNIANGTVVIFKFGAEPKHSCIVKADSSLGGYNQKGWFDSGQTSMYSDHAQDKLVFGTGKDKNQVDAHGDWHELIAVPETKAISVLKEEMKKANKKMKKANEKMKKANEKMKDQ